VRRSGGAASGVTVDYTVSDITATNGSDYTLASGTLTFEANEPSKTIVVEAVNEGGTIEPNERFVVTLSNPTGGARLGSLASVTVTIRDFGAQVRFVNGLIVNGQAFTARLTTAEGFTWSSVSGVFSPFQTVTVPQLSNFVVTAVEFGVTVPFGGFFAPVSGGRYTILLSLDDFGNPALFAIDESLPSSQAPGSVTEILRAAPGKAPGVHFAPLGRELVPVP
jgi:hypothetical protein